MKHRHNAHLISIVRKLMLIASVCVMDLGCYSPHAIDPSQGVAEGLYREAASATWDDYATNTKFEAKLITLVPRLIDAPDNAPVSRLTIKNQTTGRTILRQDIDYLPIEMHVANLFGHEHAVVLETAAASAKSVMIFAVSPSSARVVLDQDYRVGVSFIPNADYTVDVYITSGAGGVGPFYTTRYVYDGRSYKAAGTLPYEDFTALLEERFKKK